MIMNRFLIITSIIFLLYFKANSQKNTKITDEYRIESRFAFPNHIAFGGNLGYQYNNLSFLEAGGGIKTQLSKIVLGAGYNIEMNFDKKLNNNKVYFELGYNYGFDLIGTFNYLKLNELNTQLKDELIRAEIGIGAPALLPSRRGKLHLFAHIRLKYGYNFLLSKQTGVDLGKHSFNVSLLIGGAIILRPKQKK